MPFLLKGGQKAAAGVLHLIRRLWEVAESIVI
jgi:hypothetical protein